MTTRRRPLVHGRWPWVAGAVVALGLAFPPVLAGQLPETPRPSLEVVATKPLMGENYDRVSGLLALEVRVPRSADGGWILRGGLAYSTAGRTRSATLANPAVGAWGHPGGVPLELLVSLPLSREMGDDDFATDMALLSDIVHRERYLVGRWGVSLAAVPHFVFRDGSVADVELGAVALPPHGASGTDVRARFGASIGLGFTRAVQAGGRFTGTLRLTGKGSFDQRAQQDLAVLLRFVRMRGQPELSFRLPIDIDLQDYVTGVVGLRVRF
jgi:hypothetical protein